MRERETRGERADDELEKIKVKQVKTERQERERQEQRDELNRKWSLVRNE